VLLSGERPAQDEILDYFKMLHVMGVMNLGIRNNKGKTPFDLYPDTHKKIVGIFSDVQADPTNSVEDDAVVEREMNGDIIIEEPEAEENTPEQEDDEPSAKTDVEETVHVDQDETTPEVPLEEMQGDVNLDTFGSGSGLLDLSLKPEKSSAGQEDEAKESDDYYKRAEEAFDRAIIQYKEALKHAAKDDKIQRKLNRALEQKYWCRKLRRL